MTDEEVLEEKRRKGRIRSNRWTAKHREQSRASSLATYYKRKAAGIRVDKDKKSASDHRHYLKNREKLIAYQKVYNAQNAEKVKARRKLYYENNKKACIASCNRRTKERRKTDVQFRIKTVTRNAVNRAIRSGWKREGIRSQELLGCTWLEVKGYLESRFQPGMTWENHGLRGWHIDHIRPLASFDMTDDAQVRQAFHYTNLQPLWWRENVVKGDRYEPAAQCATSSSTTTTALPPSCAATAPSAATAAWSISGTSG